MASWSGRLSVFPLFSEKFAFADTEVVEAAETKQLAREWLAGNKGTCVGLTTNELSLELRREKSTTHRLGQADLIVILTDQARRMRDHSQSSS